MLEKIYNDLLVEFQNDGVAINEVPSAELKRHNPNSETGFISYNCNGGPFHSTYILIDSSIELELKLNVLLRNTMNRIIDRHNNDPDMRYREALNCLIQDEIWKKSVELTTLNYEY